MTPSPCPICRSASTKVLFEVYDDRFGYPGAFPAFSCAQCGHRFLTASLSPEEISRLYTTFYPRSRARVEDISELAPAEGFRSWLKGEKRAAHLVPPGSKVLDIGCGFGETLLYHRARGCDAHGMEADENAKKAVDHFGLNMKIGVFGPGQYPAGSFDCITMDQVIEHLPDPRETLREIFKMLRPGGRFIFSTPNGSGLAARVFGRKWLHWHAPYHLQFFSRKSIEILARETGFKIERIEQVTCSAWTNWQWHHILHFPRPGVPSAFWTPERISSASAHSQAWKIFRFAIKAWNKVGANELISRFLDLLGIGDNFVVTFAKSKEPS